MQLLHAQSLKIRDTSGERHLRVGYTASRGGYMQDFMLEGWHIGGGGGGRGGGGEGGEGG